MERWFENGFEIRREISGCWSVWYGDERMAEFGSLQQAVEWAQSETR